MQRVRGGGLEPPWVSPYAPQTYASASFATRARFARTAGPLGWWSLFFLGRRLRDGWRLGRRLRRKRGRLRLVPLQGNARTAPAAARHRVRPLVGGHPRQEERGEEERHGQA